MESIDLVSPSSAWVELVQALVERRVNVRLRAPGGSMHPVIPDSAVVHVRPLDSGEPSLGQIVLFQRSNGSPIIHRVVNQRRARTRASYYILPDSSLAAGEWVQGCNVIGCVSLIEQRGRLVDLTSRRAKLYGAIVVLLWQVMRIGHFVPGVGRALGYLRRSLHAVIIGP